MIAIPGVTSLRVVGFVNLHLEASLKLNDLHYLVFVFLRDFSCSILSREYWKRLLSPPAITRWFLPTHHTWLVYWKVYFTRKTSLLGSTQLISIGFVCGQSLCVYEAFVRKHNETDIVTSGLLEKKVLDHITASRCTPPPFHLCDISYAFTLCGPPSFSTGRFCFIHFPMGRSKVLFKPLSNTYWLNLYQTLRFSILLYYQPGAPSVTQSRENPQST